jgi:hypothetical protein
MAKLNKFLFSSAIVLTALFGFSSTTHAMVPSLTLSTSGQTGDYVQINVIGDPNASVMLFVGSQSGVLGNTNASGVGLFSIGSSATENQATFPSSGVTIVSNVAVYVKTGGINGTMSNQVSWPYIQSSTTSGTLTLSQNGGLSTSSLAVLLTTGQTSSAITASANYINVLSNSNNQVANINLTYGSPTITIAAFSPGSDTAVICAAGSTTNCATITVTVQNSGTQQLTFSPNNFSVYPGQNVQALVSGGSGSYSISGNSNPTSVTASISGSQVIVSATGTVGTSNITVCDNNMNCGIINVNATTANSTAVTFSQSNPVVAVSQSTTVTIYGGSGNGFYVSANTNPSVAQININSNILTITGITNGTSGVTICAVSGSCGSITVNVSSTVNSGGPMSLSQTTVSILAGQSANITILGGSTPYNISSSTPSIFNGVINGNILTIYGVNAGTSTANICSSVGCTTLNITINSTTSTTNPPTFSQNNILLNIGQQTTVYVTGTGSYYISNNSNSNIATEQISGNSIAISAISSGATNVSICQSGGQCATLYITVSGTTSTAPQLILSQNNLSMTSGQNTTVYLTGNGGYYIGSNSNTSVASATISGNSVIISAIGYGTDNISICQNGSQCVTLSVSVSGQTNTATPATTVTYVFPRYLGYKDKGDDVFQLQKLLSQEGFLSATPNGYYGVATFAAVKKFQKDRGIKQTGNVGPATKDALNQVSTPVASTGATKEQQVAAIQQAIQQLLAQVAQVQAQ